eukprot:Gregarina_sp_Poly_1__1721@NODE_1444_length_4133_cov_160_835957_g144_i1_p2_GENE_NODE_1444_length_4133_cov_160_835957_g144_i1NODE_1444_length_4133_cov_160_835957_g144_i1_p2_ORF_typecomplete_len207_score28_44_NODE_1444_length_4133_cov_160_835957_g144_i113471967
MNMWRTFPGDAHNSVDGKDQSSCLEELANSCSHNSVQVTANYLYTILMEINPQRFCLEFDTFLKNIDQRSLDLNNFVSSHPGSSSDFGSYLKSIGLVRFSALDIFFVSVLNGALDSVSLYSLAGMLEAKPSTLERIRDTSDLLKPPEVLASEALAIMSCIYPYKLAIRRCFIKHIDNAVGCYLGLKNGTIAKAAENRNYVGLWYRS